MTGSQNPVTPAPISIAGLCPAKTGTLCQCGQCKHVLRREAQRRGITVTQLITRLPLTMPEAPVKEPVKRIRTLGPVATRVTVACPDGTLLQGEVAVAAAVFALRKPNKKK